MKLGVDTVRYDELYCYFIFTRKYFQFLIRILC